MPPEQRNQTAWGTLAKVLTLGVLTFLFSPLPIWPKSPQPKVQTSPFPVKRSVCAYPASIWVTRSVTRLFQSHILDTPNTFQRQRELCDGRRWIKARCIRWALQTAINCLNKAMSSFWASRLKATGVVIYGTVLYCTSELLRPRKDSLTFRLRSVPCFFINVHVRL